MARREIVSSSNEELILVDEQDREIGCKSKSDCHIGNGILHRAFSIFIFNTNNEVLIQKRSSEKLLWPSCWSNACCSHPRYGEPMKTAVVRRLVQELGFNCPLIFLYKFQFLNCALTQYRFLLGLILYRHYQLLGLIYILLAM